MRAPWRRALLGATLAPLLASPLAAAEIVLERIDTTSQGFLFLEFELADPFEGLYLEALQSGLPTRLSYTFELWRERTGWWDRLELTDEREFRMFRNLLTDEYYAVSPEETRVLAGMDSLLVATCHFRRDSPARALTLPFPSPRLSEQAEYYVVVSAKLAPMSVDDLNELDQWLRGTIRGRGDEAGGGISGLTRTMGGLLMSLTGFGDKTVRARTPNFKPTEVRQAPMRMQEKRPPKASGVQADGEPEDEVRRDGEPH